MLPEALFGRNENPSSQLLVPVVASAIAVTIVPSLFRYFFPPKKPWPVVPGGLPWIGNPFGGLENLAKTLTQWIIDYGNVPSNTTGLLECTLLGQPHVMVCNNAVALEICRLRPTKVVRPWEEKEAVNSVGANGVFSAEGDIWRKDRRIMAPPLNHKNMADYLPFIRTTTDRLITKWAEAANSSPFSSSSSKNGDNGNTIRPVAINQDLLAYTIDNIGLIAFDNDFDCLRREKCQEAEDLRTMFRLLTLRAMSPVCYWRIPLIGPYLDGGEFAFARLRKVVGATINSFGSSKSSSATTNNNNNRTRTYLEKLLTQDETMSHSRLMGNLMTMFAAGAETTGNTTMICLWELLQEGNQDLMNELVEEVLKLSPTFESTASMDDLREGLPKLRAFFYEIVRLKGTAPHLFFQAAQELQINGLPVPEGTTFYMNFSYLGGLEGSGIPKGPNGESPAIFCSQRWLVSPKDGTTKWTVIKPSPKTGVSLSTGFGNGVRICPGQDLAELEVIFCLACLLKKFHMSLVPNHPPVNMVVSFTIRPDKDIQILFRPRDA